MTSKIVKTTKISHRERCEYALLQSMGYSRPGDKLLVATTLSYNTAFHNGFLFSSLLRGSSRYNKIYKYGVYIVI